MIRALSAFCCALLLVAFAVAQEKKKDTKKDEKKDVLKLTAEEQAVIDATNAERKKAELEPLKMNPQLMEAARKHALNMAKQDKLDHVLDEKTPADRVEAANYKYRATGENIAWNQRNAKQVVAGWMDSKPHRENMLNAEYTEIGVAVARNAKGEPYWVQVFGKPR